MATVARHKTAITRYQLSAPMQALAPCGLLDDERSVFDYGCGHGHDLEVLRAAGIEALGWDPYYLPDAPHEPAHVVNLGYVLNVIEDPRERIDTARRAFELARVCLAVAVMIVGKYDVSGMRPHGDGYLSNRGTFQKYFVRAEIKQLLEDALENEAIAVAPGMFFVFRDKIEEQRFLAERTRRARDISALLLPRARPERVTATQARIEAHRGTLARLWQRTLELGRWPHEDELNGELIDAIRTGLGTIGKALQLARRLFDPADLEGARTARVEDRRLYFALNLFNRRRPYRTLPPELQRDIKAFLGSHKAAEAAGRQLLFSLGDPSVIREAYHAAAAAGLGQLQGQHSLQLHDVLVDRLPAPLRAYIGCAEKLYGSVQDADLLKIHIRSGKVTLLCYEDFDDDPLPRLVERTKIDMRAQNIDFFDHRDRPQLLYLKSRYLPPTTPPTTARRPSTRRCSVSVCSTSRASAPTRTPSIPRSPAPATRSAASKWSPHMREVRRLVGAPRRVDRHEPDLENPVVKNATWATAQSHRPAQRCGATLTLVSRWSCRRQPLQEIARIGLAPRG